MRGTFFSPLLMRLNLARALFSRRGSAGRDGAALGLGAVGVLTTRVFGILLALAAQVVVARSLGVSGLGEYVYAMTSALIVSQLALLGLPNATMRYVAAYRATTQWGLLRGFLKRSITSAVLSGVAGAIVMLMLPSLIGAHFGSEFSSVMGWAAPLVPAMVLTNLQVARLRALKQAVRGTVLITVVQNAIFLASFLLVTRAAGAAPTPTLAMATYFASFVLVMLAATFWAARALPSEVRHAQCSFKTQEWASSAASMLFIAACGLFLRQSDIVLLGIVFDHRSVGLYAPAVRLATVLSFGMEAVTVSIAPLIAGMHARGQVNELKGLLRLSAAGILGFTAPAAVVLLALRARLLALWGPEFTSASGALVILVVGHLVNALTGVVGDLMLMTGNERQAGRYLAGTATLNIILCVFLIPRFGIMGAATACAFTTCTWNALLVAHVWRHMKLDPTICSLWSSRNRLRPEYAMNESVNDLAVENLP